MSDLAKTNCEACRADAPKVTDAELAALIKEIPDWAAVSEDSILMLRRQYSFSNFKKAMAFSNRVGDLAEEYGHHPAILTEWGKVTVTWWTHKISGLHKNDFVMAAKTDLIPTD
ncbi:MULTISPECIES: 4a-hydroxytetrahydrobiopterin dehydratase [Corallincola]|uniref:Putative pterin-4-alpha-carbinolamine dehydratase n=3 Tax=Corallincola TaxID=1775176 RepID=A0A368NS16_9GAMM|nr:MULTISPECIES: 4a-hydroxytetrahydrobiopterin dehydratase [Corallincola]RCU52900.1 4a-hydroxytetrahydrobiopterin dehydratase [Corallincola holothuriorum]TAA47946.1 4a-hydroxytetrahydrobiopterin dehydratase [Corallincola spongiicola]TCI03396.1 4a-hydroxytetrahydrobiopterin dehydratase [Corallincola luteus]